MKREIFYAKLGGFWLVASSEILQEWIVGLLQICDAIMQLILLLKR